MINPSTKENKNEISDSSFTMNNSFRKDSFMISNNDFSSFKYAGKGLSYAFLSQRNFRIHVFIGLLVIVLSIWLKLSFSNCAILLLTISTVLVLELINTAIEAVVDLAIGRRFHLLARIAKDCAAASVLISAFSSFFIALLILLPPILEKLGF